VLLQRKAYLPFFDVKQIAASLFLGPNLKKVHISKEGLAKMHHNELFASSEAAAFDMRDI
jgi:hypothetical protein